MQIRIMPSKPALILEGERKSLVIADVHIGFEGRMKSNQVFVGKNSSVNEMISEVLGMIDSEDPDAVILLGDVKSSITGIERNEWDEVPRFLDEISKKADVTLVPGNHDAGIQRLVPDNISMIGSAGMIEENALLTHGHAMPSENFSHVDRIIMGHVHPVFFQEDSVVNGQRVWVSVRTSKENIFPSRSGEIEITIVPSFNKYLYATHRIRKRSTSPIIDRMMPISAARITTLDGTIIGDESTISQVL